MELTGQFSEVEIEYGLIFSIFSSFLEKYEKWDFNYRTLSFDLLRLKNILMYSLVKYKSSHYWLPLSDLETGNKQVRVAYFTCHARVAFVYRIIYITDHCDEITTNYDNMRPKVVAMAGPTGIGKSIMMLFYIRTLKNVQLILQSASVTDMAINNIAHTLIVKDYNIVRASALNQIW
uniref:ATPase_AAA_core domain-containing protein n=1 Tax=Strongyloides stercoralis TaxID=6248 RepID=A0A0K0ETC3_STRER